jgi:hypothetical protein
MALGPVDVDRQILVAFARLAGHGQHGPEDLKCRIVERETSEGYPIQGKEDLEVYAEPADPWYQKTMADMQGHEGPFTISIYRTGIEPETDPVALIRGVLARKLTASRESYEEVRALLGPLGIT